MSKLFQQTLNSTIHGVSKDQIKKLKMRCFQSQLI